MPWSVLKAVADTVALALISAQQPVPPIRHKIHDPNRPQPRVVDPGPAQRNPAPRPADAIALITARGMADWESDKEGPAKWIVRRGVMEIAPGTGDIRTKQKFGDCQLHIEWATPRPGVGEGQNSGNSGVFLMNLYEIQVLNSYKNKTYPDGQCAAIYGQYPPLVNASRPPGEWQSYDIVFRRPRFDRAGKLLRPATMTVLHNGVLVHDKAVLTGPTGHTHRPPYWNKEPKRPLKLQDHGFKVRYRNIWIRPLE